MTLVLLETCKVILVQTGKTVTISANTRFNKSSDCKVDQYVHRMWNAIEKEEKLAANTIIDDAGVKSVLKKGTKIRLTHGTKVMIQKNGSDERGYVVQVLDVEIA